MDVKIPAASCRHCGQICLVALPGLPDPTVAEYFEKVTLHESQCDKNPERLP